MLESAFLGFLGISNFGLLVHGTVRKGCAISKLDSKREAERILDDWFLQSSGISNGNATGKRLRIFIRQISIDYL